MAHKVSELLTPEQVRSLRGKSDLVGALLVLHAWGLIAGSMALFVWWPNPLTFVLAVMVIGTRQLGLAILMHDAAHGLLFANRRLNEWVGTWLCAAPIFTSLTLYRPYHLTHHRHTQQAEDPDLGLSAPFPITRGSLWRKISRDLTGRTAYQRRLEQFRGGLAKEWRSFVANLVLLGASRRRRLLVALSGAMAGAARDLVSAREPYPEHRRACGRAGQRRPAAQYAHHPGQLARAAVRRALLGELPPRAPSLHVRAVLAAADGPSGIAGGGMGQSDGDPARLRRMLRLATSRRSGEPRAARGRRGAQHI